MKMVVFTEGVDYPKYLHKLHSDLPFLPEIKKSIMSKNLSVPQKIKETML